MELDKPNPIFNVLLFKEELWIREYSIRMQRWLNGKKLPPVRIDAELHRRCNLNCLHCNRRSSKEDMNKQSLRIEIPDRYWLRLAHESGKQGVKSWNIAGIGEPMCRSKLVLKLIKILKSYSIFGELTTNGTLWQENDVKSVVKMLWDSVSISLDAPDAKTHDYIRRVPGTFEKAVRTMKWFRKYRDYYELKTPCLVVNLVLNKLNYSKLPEMIEFVSGIGADAIFVEPMIVYSDLGKKLKMADKDIEKLPSIIKETQKKAKKLNIATFISCLEGDGKKKEVNKDLVKKTSEIREVILSKMDGKISKNEIDRILEIPCYYPWFNLMVTADGSAIHCGECTQFKDNIKDKTLKEIWYGEYLEDIRNSYLNKNLPSYCQRCRPNVIGDMKLVRRSIKEFTDINQLHTRIINLARENRRLKDQLYYFKTKQKPKNPGLFKRVSRRFLP